MTTVGKIRKEESKKEIKKKFSSEGSLSRDNRLKSLKGVEIFYNDFWRTLVL